MEQPVSQKKTLLIVCLVAVGVILLLLGAFLLGSRQKERETIVLPEPTAPTQKEDPPEPEAPALAQVQPDNIQAILQSLSRPSAYYQIFTVSQFASGKSCSQTVYLWVNGSIVHADMVSQTETKSILTDGTTLYLWYDDEDAPVCLTLDAETSMDDLLGIATYETIAKLDPEAITDAELTTSEDANQESCVRVEVQNGAVLQEYRVSLDSGLLLRHTMTEGERTLYEMEQKSLERLADGDEVFSNIFTLPDGTEPFS